MKIVCLHTVESNKALFDAAARAEGVDVTHVMRDDLLRRAEASSGLTAEIRRETAAVLRALAAGADAVLLTCSTLGPSVEDVSAAVPVLRVDSALAEVAVATAGRLVVLCALETTVQPTKSLFERAANGRPVNMSIEVVPDAWALHKAGDREGYLNAIAAAADEAVVDGSSVAFAQASMAPAVERCRRATPLTSPTIGMAAAIAAARRHG